jgi:hypothetical protein
MWARVKEIKAAQQAERKDLHSSSSEMQGRDFTKNIERLAQGFINAELLFNLLSLKRQSAPNNSTATLLLNTTEY